MKTKTKTMTVYALLFALLITVFGALIIMPKMNTAKADNEDLLYKNGFTIKSGITIIEAERVGTSVAQFFLDGYYNVDIFETATPNVYTTREALGGTNYRSYIPYSTVWTLCIISDREQFLTIFDAPTNNGYTVSYYDGTTLLSDLTQSDQRSLSTPNPPEKPGYDFMGWCSDSSLTTLAIDGSEITSDINIYAKYSVSENSGKTVNYWYGDTQLTDLTQTGQTTLNLPIAPDMAGYIFEGWYLDYGCVNAASNGYSVPNTMDIFAKYTEIPSYTVDYYDGITALNDLDQSAQTTLTLPAAPEKSGYVFEGWYTDSALTTIAINGTALTMNIYIYAKYTVVYTVTYFDGETAMTAMNQISQRAFNPPAAPAKSGYVFEGWYTDSALTNAIVSGTVLTANITVYAKYTVVYTVTYFDGTTELTELTQAEQTTLTLPTAPVKADYTFYRWCTNSGFTREAINGSALTANTTIYAQYTLTAGYTLTFYDDDSADLSALTQTNQTIFNPLPAPNKPGYRFSFYDNDRYDPLVSLRIGDRITQDIRVYMYYAPITVKYYQDGYTELTSLTQTHQATLNLQSAPARAGYTFDGWFIDRELTTLALNGIELNDDINIYAKYTLSESNPPVDEPSEDEPPADSLDDILNKITDVINSNTGLKLTGIGSVVLIVLLLFIVFKRR